MLGKQRTKSIGDHSKVSATNRRGFLAAAGVGVIGLASSSGAAATEVAPPIEKLKPSLGYQESEHVRAYYRSLSA